MGRKIAMVFAVALLVGCGSELFGHHYRYDYIQSFSAVPAALPPGGIAELSVVVGEDWPPDANRLMIVMHPTIRATSGALYVSRAEAEAGLRDTEHQYYSHPDLDRIDYRRAFFRAPDSAQTVTLTATYGESRNISVVVQ